MASPVGRRCAERASPWLQKVMANNAPDDEAQACRRWALRLYNGFESSTIYEEGFHENIPSYALVMAFCMMLTASQALAHQTLEAMPT